MRTAGVWQQLGLKRVRGCMQKQVRAAGAIQLTAQPRPVWSTTRDL